MSERVILAYSGGLDTSVAISWIGKETGREVVAVAIDLGQGGEDMELVRQRALDCGAVEAVVVDARDEFADEFAWTPLFCAIFFGCIPECAAVWTRFFLRVTYVFLGIVVLYVVVFGPSALVQLCQARDVRFR